MRSMEVGARAMNGAEWLLLLALSCLWGSSFFFYKVLDGALPPFTIVLGRVALAALLLNLLLLARGAPLRRHMPWTDFIVQGSLNCVIPFSLFAWGELQVTSGMAAMLNAATPLFAVLLAHALGRERLTWSRALGVAAGLAGVAVLVGPAALSGGTGSLAGAGACLVAAVSYAVAGQYARRLQHLPILQVAAGQLSGATLVMIPLALLVDGPWDLPVPAPAIWAALVGIAVLCTALAYMLFFRLLSTAGPTNAVLVTFLLPISALCLGWLLLREPVSVRAYPGMLLIGVGLAAIDGRLMRIRQAGARQAGARQAGARQAGAPET